MKTFSAKSIVLTVIGLGVLAAIGGALFVWFGLYNVAATEQHTTLTYHLLHYAMQRSVKMRVKDIQPPPLDDEGRIERGMALYRDHCVKCHGGPGVPPDPFAFGLRPEPANLVEAGREWHAPEVYWVIKHGIKMAGMPGWQYRLTEDQLWDLTAFVATLPRLSPAEYETRSAKLPPSAPVTGSKAADRKAAMTRIADNRVLGDPDAGLHAIYQYMCVTCHAIPGAVGAVNTVGPPLAGIANRKYIAGVLRNTPENMVRWLRHPKEIDPLSGMPDLNVSEGDARDIAAYLYTLEKTK